MNLFWCIFEGVELGEKFLHNGIFFEKDSDFPPCAYYLGGDMEGERGSLLTFEPYTKVQVCEKKTIKVINNAIDNLGWAMTHINEDRYPSTIQGIIESITELENLLVKHSNQSSTSFRS